MADAEARRSGRVGRSGVGELQAHRFGRVTVIRVKQMLRDLILLCAFGDMSEKICHSSGKENGLERIP